MVDDAVPVRRLEHWVVGKKWLKNNKAANRLWRDSDHGDPGPASISEAPSVTPDERFYKSKYNTAVIGL